MIVSFLFNQMPSILEAKLHKEWPNLLKGTDEDFWKMNGTNLFFEQVFAS